MHELPDDFDADIYLQLHEDVAAAKVDPIEHYLKFGRLEGRPYKKENVSPTVVKLSTMVITNIDLFHERLGAETLLVTGPERGGTSIVAYALLRMKYPLQSDTGANHELRAFVDAAGEPAKLIRVISEQDNKNARWGFKLPSALRSLQWYTDHLRMPVALIVCRNPLAIYRSIDKHDKELEEGKVGFQKGLGHALAYLQATKAALDCSAPVVFVDVDLAQRKPVLFLKELASLFGLEFDEEIASEISQPGYKSLPSNND